MNNCPDHADHIPYLVHDANGAMSSSTGSHARLGLNDPLHLSNSLVLANHAVAGNGVAFDASVRRSAAFHEAGHLWAAHTFATNLVARRLSDPSRPIRGCSADIALAIRAFGPLVAGIAVEADTCEFLGIDSEYGATFGTHMLPSITDGTLPTRQHRRALTYALHAIEWIDAYCGRGGDTEATFLFHDLEWVEATVPEVIHHWWGIERLARRLLAGTPMSSVNIAEALTDPGHRR